LNALHLTLSLKSCEFKTKVIASEVHQTVLHISLISKKGLLHFASAISGSIQKVPKSNPSKKSRKFSSLGKGKESVAKKGVLCALLP